MINYSQFWQKTDYGLKNDDLQSWFRDICNDKVITWGEKGVGKNDKGGWNMSSYGELIKKPWRIRAYMRDFSVYSFKSRDEYSLLLSLIFSRRVGQTDRIRAAIWDTKDTPKSWRENYIKLGWHMKTCFRADSICQPFDV